MFSGRPARGGRPATASECVDHLIKILCKNLDPPLISLYFASKEFQFSMKDFRSVSLDIDCLFLYFQSCPCTWPEECFLVFLFVC